ncbi:MAG: phenylalanine--tRNA ligase beta subunit-related protein [Acidobacteria bacterium]|nr:phenylalanine--tRNA ligase beta subunit-related protein [Acidobacteriota bacterium]
MLESRFSPMVDESVWRRFADYRALSITVTGFRPEAPVASYPIHPAVWADAHIAAWHQAFRDFGANPKRSSPSVDSLLRRYRKDNGLPSIHPVVDLYNSVSLNWGISAGGEDMALYQGSPRLVVADGSEGFDTSRDGQPVVEAPEPGEIVWRDDAGITCRRWNWRQCRRTAITESTVDFWFVLDRLPPMELDDLHRAGDSLTSALQAASPQCRVESHLVAPKL